MAKRTSGWILTLAVCCAVGGGTAMDGHGPLILAPVQVTDPLYAYEDAPATPDADDPAIWVNRGSPRKSLLIGTAKDAGLLAYDMSGRLVQALFPPNAPQVLAVDPPTPAGINPASGRPCIDSDSGETFGRFNNVDIAYDVQLAPHPSSRVDVAVVSDRGCDRIRFYRMDPTDPKAHWSTSRPSTSRGCSRPATSNRHHCSPRAQSKDGETIRSTIRTPSTDSR